MPSKSKPAVIAELTGGLGNQLFIYATARRLALKNGVPLYLDTVSGFRWDSQYRRRFMLNFFRLKAEIIPPPLSAASIIGTLENTLTGKEFLAARVNRMANILRKGRCELRSYAMRKHLFQPGDAFDGRLLSFKVQSPVRLHGMWQSEKFFKDAEASIREELQPNGRISEKVLKTAERLRAENSVCLHIRRFQDIPKKNTFGLKLGEPYRLPVKYYEEALNLLSRRVSNPSFFCFGDDPEWLRRALPARFPIEYISSPDAADQQSTLEEFWLMSQCRHFIIANSTFSWWAAWLAEHENKIVVSPPPPGSNPDFVPEEWTVLA